MSTDTENSAVCAPADPKSHAQLTPLSGPAVRAPLAFCVTSVEPFPQGSKAPGSSHGRTQRSPSADGAKPVSQRQTEVTLEGRDPGTHMQARSSAGWARC